MTQPPHGDAEPARQPAPGADGRPRHAGPPPQGAAPYGAGPLAAPAVVAVAVLVGIALLVGIAVLALSTGPTVLSRTAVERDVGAQFEQREGVAVDLRCTQEMPVQEGATYECSGITADDEEVTLRIQIADEDGARYTWSEP